MPSSFRPYAALIVPQPGGVTPDTFLCSVKAVLAIHDGQSGTPPRVSQRHAAVQSDTLLFKVAVAVAPKEGARVTFRMAVRPNATAPSVDVQARILSDVILKSLALVTASCVEWLNPNIRIPPEEFRASQSYVSPRRSRREMVDVPVSEADVDAIERNLSRMLADAPETLFSGPPTQPRRGPRGYATSPRKRRMVDPADIATIVPAPPTPCADSAAEAKPTSLRGRIIERIFGRLPRALVRHSAQGTALGGFGVTLHQTGMFRPVLQLVGV